ncbi:oligosaccharyl transferase, STT3 subunit, partial [Thermococcus sp. ES12]|nr:oligosaccharyl transferase, STT3 subunit [Thermococcus sp. ES12]
MVKPNLSISNTNTYLYINLDYKYAIFMNEEAFNTTLARLFIRPEEPYEVVYSDGGVVKILKLKHPNVKVEKDGEKVILRFENATGTGVGIWGF